jgi:hypothetical protein
MIPTFPLDPEDIVAIKAAQVDRRYTSELDDEPTYRADFRDYVFYVEYRNGDDIGLAPLLGFDPTDPASPAYRNDVTEFNRAEGDASSALYQREGR